MRIAVFSGLFGLSVVLVSYSLGILDEFPAVEAVHSLFSPQSRPAQTVRLTPEQLEADARERNRLRLSKSLANYKIAPSRCLST